jgi:hypothetical protein
MDTAARGRGRGGGIEQQHVGAGEPQKNRSTGRELEKNRSTGSELEMCFVVLKGGPHPQSGCKQYCSHHDVLCAALG